MVLTLDTMLRPAATVPARPTTFQVLVVDADRATCSALDESIGDLAVVRAVPDVYQALYELTSQPFDAVVTELFLPGASGLDLLERMHAKGLHAPAIVFTQAHGSYPELGALGVRHVLHKPSSRARLRAALAGLLGVPLGCTA